MLLALAGAAALSASVGVAFGVPLRGEGALAGALVLADLAAFGALGGALLDALVAGLRRRRLPTRTLAATLLLSLAGAAHLAFAPAAPAAIVMVVDCLRADRFDAGTMPKLTRRLDDAVRFTRARSQSSWTRSAMPSLLSGRYPIEHGLFRTRPPDRIKADVTMVAERFRDAGFLTGAFVEQAQLDAAFGYDRGFGRFGWRDGTAPTLNARLLRWNALFRTVPRFVLVHYVDVHGPYKPKAAFRPKDLPPSTLATRPSSRWRATIRGIRSGKIVPTAQDWAHLAGLYDGEVRQIDARIDTLLARLAADGTLDAAWFVFTADHGERFGEHGEIEHMGVPDETVISVPLLVRPPGGTTRRTVHDVVQHVDVVPTLLGAFGLPGDDALPGRDLAPALRGEPLAPAPSFAEEWAGKTHRATVRDGDWKLHRGARTALFDLAADPREERDLAAERPDVVARLEGLLAAYFAAAEAGRPIATVDWAAAATSGAVWEPGAAPAADAAEASEATMKALEALGYLEAE
ncbi:MAG: sulfatase [Myxococcota bacterium]